MNSFRLMLASSDPEYDRAFSAWMKKKWPPFSTDILDPQRWFDVTEEEFDAYDRILLGGALKHIHEGPGVRIAGGFGSGGKGGEEVPGTVDPYRPAEEVFRDLIGEPLREQGPLFSVRTVGFVPAEEASVLSYAADSIISALAVAGKTVLQADLRDFPTGEQAVFRRDGSRSWDDFLYSCIYARTPDILTEPERHAGRDDFGVLRFPMAPGPNPYRTLTERELRMMYGRIREYCPVDYFAAFLPERDSPVYRGTLLQMDLILILYRDSEESRERLTEIIRQVKEEADPAKRILEICVSDRHVDRDLPGFLLHMEEGSGAAWADNTGGMPPEDLTAVTEFIHYGCFI